jgi:hypothetical protein
MHHLYYADDVGGLVNGQRMRVQAFHCGPLAIPAPDSKRLVLTPEYREKDAKDVQKFLDDAVAKIEAMNPSEN